MTPSAPDQDQNDAAHIARSCEELRNLASRSQFGFLAYLLDMARLEAEAQRANGKPGSGRGSLDNQKKERFGDSSRGGRQSDRL